MFTKLPIIVVAGGFLPGWFKPERGILSRLTKCFLTSIFNLAIIKPKMFLWTPQDILSNLLGELILTKYLISVAENFQGSLFLKDFYTIRTRNIGYALLFLQLCNTAIQQILAFNACSNDTRSTTTPRIFDVDFEQVLLFCWHYYVPHFYNYHRYLSYLLLWFLLLLLL